MKKTSLLFNLLFVVSVASSQITFSVNYTSSLSSGKKMTGVNTGPNNVNGNSTQMCLQAIGNELIRTHDYNGPCDYYNYTDFYNSGSFNYSFQSHDPAGYNWFASDIKIDQIVNAGMHPFFRLGISMPGSGGGPVTPMPIDSDGYNFRTFAGISKRTVMHYNDGWANGDNYSIKYWEVWNEPNHAESWDGTPSDYYKMFDQVEDSIHTFDPSLLVGGPGTASNAFYNGGIHYTINHDYVGNFMSYCQSNNIPLDFYSFHMYDKKNPYHVRILTDTIAYFLNQYGFTNTELIISESSITTGGYSNTSKGCSYLASELISLVGSRLSKYILYRGVDIAPLCNEDNPDASLTLNGYAYKFFNEVNDSTPNLLVSQGNLFNSDNILDSLNNVMLLAGKNNSNNVVKILVSHHESTNNSINITLNNLNWQSSDQIEITTEKVISSGYSVSNSSMNGGSTLNLSLNNVLDASVYLITLKNLSMNSVEEEQLTDLQIYPNPSNETVNIQTQLKYYSCTLSDLYGKVVYVGQNTDKLDVSRLTAGTYFVSIEDLDSSMKINRMIIVE